MDCWSRLDDCGWIFHVSCVYGMVHFLEVPLVQIFLWLFGSFILLFTGVESMVNVNSLTIAPNREKDSLFKCFITGFIMSITSPLSILFWLGIYGSVLAKTAQVNSSSSLLIYSSKIFLGLQLLYILIVDITYVFQQYLY